MTGNPWSAEKAIADAVDLATRVWRQGDVFGIVTLLRLANTEFPITRQTARLAASGKSGTAIIHGVAEQVVLVTQTCDVVRACVERPYVHVAAVVLLEVDVLKEAAKDRRPQYAALPGLGAGYFADLDNQTMVEKPVLMAKDRTTGMLSEHDRLRFARSLSRHRSRFAFPDDLARTLKPFVQKMADKAGKSTPQGRRVDEVVEIRARSDDWQANDCSVELILIVTPQSLPDLPDAADEDGEPTGISQLNAERLAEALDTEADVWKRNSLWHRLVDAWAESIRPVGSIREVTALAVSTTELGHAEANSAPLLDLDHLSAP